MIRLRLIGVDDPTYSYGAVIERAADGLFFCFDQQTFVADGQQTRLVLPLAQFKSRFAAVPAMAAQLGRLYGANLVTPIADPDPAKNWANGDYFIYYYNVAPDARIEVAAQAVLYAGDDLTVIAKVPANFRANINFGYPEGTDPHAVPRSGQLAAALTYDAFRR